MTPSRHHGKGMYCDCDELLGYESKTYVCLSMGERDHSVPSMLFFHLYVLRFHYRRGIVPVTQDPALPTTLWDAWKTPWKGNVVAQLVGNAHVMQYFPKMAYIWAWAHCQCKDAVPLHGLTLQEQTAIVMCLFWFICWRGGHV